MTQPPGPRLSLIVAMARNRVIGADGKLPWHLATDLKRFRALTMGHHIIMGRKTYESIGRPLPGRVMIVVTGNPAYEAPQCVIAASLEQALECAQEDSEAFVVGGAQLYALALPVAQRIYLTEIDAEVAGDTLFPDFDRSSWDESERIHHPRGDRDDYAHDFVVLERKA